MRLKCLRKKQNYRIEDIKQQYSDRITEREKTIKQIRRKQNMIKAQGKA